MIQIICLIQYSVDELYLGRFLKRGVLYAYVPIILGLLLSDYFEIEMGIVHASISINFFIFNVIIYKDQFKFN